MADRDRVGQLFANVSYKELTVQAVYGSREKGIPTASFGTVFNDSRAHTTDSRGYVDVGYQHDFRNRWNLSGRVSFDNYTYHGDYPYNYDPDAGSAVTLNHDESDGKWWGEELNLSRPLFTHHRITVGNEYRHNLRQQQSNFDLDPREVYLDDRRSSKVWAFYAQDEYSLWSNVLLTMGIRHDHESTFGGTTNPRLALIYDPIEGTTLKLLYGTAFRAPNAYELYYQSSASELPNPRLQPETIRTVEFVVEQYVGESYRMSGSIFQNKIDGLIDRWRTRTIHCNSRTWDRFARPVCNWSPTACGPRAEARRSITPMSARWIPEREAFSTMPRGTSPTPTSSFPFSRNGLTRAWISTMPAPPHAGGKQGSGLSADESDSLHAAVSGRVRAFREHLQPVRQTVWISRGRRTPPRHHFPGRQDVPGKTPVCVRRQPLDRMQFYPNHNSRGEQSDNRGTRPNARLVYA